MVLREVLEKLVSDGDVVLLKDDNDISKAADLLKCLSESTLNRQAYLQPGLYIAEINDKGYLGSVLYKFI